MADDVTITVGVALDKVSAGVEAIKEQFTTLKETLATVFAVGGLGLFVEKMAELGEETERAAAILGVSAEAAQELGVIAQVSGGSLEGITTQLTRLTVGLERGAKETSLQAQALKALGISASQFISVPMDKQMNLLSDAVKRLHDQGINAAPAIAMISRGLAAMMPELVQGSAYMDQLRQRSIDVGAVVSGETTKALAEMHTELVLLWDSLKGLGETIAAAITPAFKEMASAIGTAAGNLSALIATGKIGPYLWEALKTGVQGLSAAFNQDAEAAEEVRKKEEALGESLTGIVKKYHDLIAAASAASALKPARVDVLGVDKDAIKEADDQYKRAEQIAKEGFDSFQITETQKTEFLKAQLAIRANAEILAHKKAGVAYADEAKEVAKLEAEQTKKITDAWKSMADSIASDFSTALDSVLSKQQSFGQAMMQMFGKMIEQMIAGLVKLLVEYTLLSAVAGTALAPNLKAPNFGALAGGISPLLGGLLGGGGAGQSAALTANTTALTALTTAITGHAAVTVTDTAATVTDTAATAGQTVVTGANTVAQSGTAAAWVANTTATTLNTIATLGKAILGGDLIGAASGLWNVGQAAPFPSYASGTVGVPGTQLALLHAGEMVIPAAPAAQIRDGGAALSSAGLGGGGGNVSLNISAIDSRSIAQMFMSNKNVMNTVLTEIARINPGAVSRLATGGGM